MLATSVAYADRPIEGHPTPLLNELLSDSINLSNNCSKVRIMEWRGGQQFTSRHKALMNETCNLVVDEFYDFVNDKGYPAERQVNPSYDVSGLSPGLHYRDLNDNYYRFQDRPTFCDINGRECSDNETPWILFGWTDKREQYVFIRSDYDISISVGERSLKVIWAHELFHVMSWETGSFNQHGSKKLDEMLAHQFTKFIGVGDI